MRMVGWGLSIRAGNCRRFHFIALLSSLVPLAAVDHLHALHAHWMMLRRLSAPMAIEVIMACPTTQEIQPML